MALLSYLLQVILASGILYAYYHFVLRNNRFHQYNRYFLLLVPVISILVPFLDIPVYLSSASNDPASGLLNSLSGHYSFYFKGGSQQLAARQSHGLSLATITWILYALIAAVVLIRLTVSFVRVWKLRRLHAAEKIEELWFIPTDAKGTPFSFFNWLFWNRQLPLDSSGGQQIFKHELYHIRQRHSIDVLWMEVVNVVFWINPFFHLTRRELRAIHEFLADRFAAAPNREWDYAEILLMQVLQTNNALVTPFFHNQLKRRIAMITSSKQPRYQYLRKLLVLPLLAMVTFLFAFSYHQRAVSSTHNDSNQPSDTPRVRQNNVFTITSDSIRFKVVDDKPMRTTRDTLVVEGKRLSQDQMVEQYGKSIRITGGEMRITEKPMPDGIESARTIEFQKGKIERDQVIEVRATGSNREPLFVIDGKSYPGQAGKLELERLMPNQIMSVTVLKDKSAVEKYGAVAANGVIEIRTKKNDAELTEVTVAGYKIAKDRKFEAERDRVVINDMTAKPEVKGVMLQKIKKEEEERAIATRSKPALKALAQMDAIYPNPANTEARIVFNASEDGLGLLQVYDINGHAVASQKTTVVKGANNIPVDVSALPAGTYMVAIDLGNGNSNVFKLVKR